LKIKALAEMPAKKASFKSHMNQQLTLAMAFIAGVLCQHGESHGVVEFLCISKLGQYARGAKKC
jgi:hypothetical protein